MSQTSGGQHQPAAELIVNALQKIKKLAGHRKHANLSDQCQHLIDNIHEVRCPQDSLFGAVAVTCVLSYRSLQPADDRCAVAAAQCVVMPFNIRHVLTA